MIASIVLWTYRAATKILCAHLIERYRAWFGVRMEFDSASPRPAGSPVGCLPPFGRLYSTT